MPFLSKNYLNKDYQKDIVLLKNFHEKIFYDAEYPDLQDIRNFFKIYNRVYKYLSYSLCQNLFSEKELDFLPFESNLNNFTKTTERDFVLSTPLTETFIENKVHEWGDIFYIWHTIKEEPENLILHQDHDIDEFIKSLETITNNLKQRNAANFVENAGYLRIVIGVYNSYRKQMLEYLTARDALFETFQRLKNFSFFEKMIIKTIYYLDESITLCLFQLLFLKKELMSWYR